MISISEFSFENPRFRALLDRNRAGDQEVTTLVQGILDAVRTRGDEALFEYMRTYDGVELTPQTVRVTDEEFESARGAIKPEFADAVRRACDNLFKFHQHQLPKPYTVDYEDGVKLQRIYRPIERVGVCVPGAAAPLVSSLYMLLVPALVAGVPEITIISPPRRGGIDPHVLYVADYLGVHTVYKIAGAQGIAALAYGTDSIPRVDKIVGPGNVYTQTAKRLLYGTVGIDAIAGPSEVAIIADRKASARHVAVDLLAQAEHGTGREACVAFCESLEQAEQISAELIGILRRHDLGDTVSRALLAYGNIFVVPDLATAVDAVNMMAPEHLELLCEKADELVPLVQACGAIFVGTYSAEPVGDYYCGTNHVLPTGGTARFASGLSVLDFVRGFSVVHYTGQALAANGPAIRLLAEAEGLRAHSLAIALRESDASRESGPPRGEHR